MLKKLVLPAMLAAFFACPVLAQTPSSYQLKDNAGNTFQVKDFLCGSNICPASVPIDVLGNPLTGGAGTTNSNNTALYVQGVTGGVPLTVNLGTLNGAATSALQQSILTAIGTPLQAGGQVTNAGTFAVQLTGGSNNLNNITGTISLPTGAATATLQGTANTSLASIDTKTPALGQALSAASTPVVLPAAQITALTPPTSVGITGSVAVTGTFFQATQPVSLASLPAFSSPPTVLSFASIARASITRSANTTTYTANTGWNNGTPTFFSFTGACRANGTQVRIPRIDIWSSANPATKLAGLLWLFAGIPGTNISDNAAFTIASADFANLTGSFGGIPFTLGNNQAAGATNSGTSLTGLTYQGQCAAGSTTITGMVEVTNAYVPASGEVLNVGLATVGVN